MVGFTEMVVGGAGFDLPGEDVPEAGEKLTPAGADGYGRRTVGSVEAVDVDVACSLVEDERIAGLHCSGEWVIDQCRDVSGSCTHRFRFRWNSSMTR